MKIGDIVKNIYRHKILAPSDGKPKLGIIIELPDDDAQIRQVKVSTPTGLEWWFEGVTVKV